jgi:hypothetical protein
VIQEKFSGREGKAGNRKLVGREKVPQNFVEVESLEVGGSLGFVWVIVPSNCGPSSAVGSFLFSFPCFSCPSDAINSRPRLIPKSMLWSLVIV